MLSSGKCEELVTQAKKFPKIEALLYAIKNATKEDVNIECRICNNTGVEGNARAFTQDDPLQITLCTNRLQPNDVEEVLAHELIHVFDYRLQRCDFSSCDGLAYSEVRAAREAECRGPFLFDWFRLRCIRINATKSTSNLFPASAASCVNNVFDIAVKDHSPLTSEVRDIEP
eukprot:gene2764-5447_t